MTVLIALLKVLCGLGFGWLMVEIPGRALAKSPAFQKYMEKKYCCPPNQCDCDQDGGDHFD